MSRSPLLKPQPHANLRLVYRFLHDCRRRPQPAGPRRQAPRNVVSILDSARELGIRDAQPMSGRFAVGRRPRGPLRLSGPPAGELDGGVPHAPHLVGREFQVGEVRGHGWQLYNEERAHRALGRLPLARAEEHPPIAERRDGLG